MSSETITFNQGFQKRLNEILSMHPGVWWEKELGVSNSLIGARWKKGTMPRVDKLIKMCQLTGVSANWLFLGIEPKLLGDEIAMDGGVQEIRDKMKDFVALYKENRELKRYIDKLSKKESAIDNLISIVKLLSANKDFIDNVDALENISNKEFFEQYIAPLNVLIKSFSDIVFKLLAVIVETDAGKDFIAQTFKFFTEEYEKNKLLAQYRFKELDPLFKSQKLIEKIHSLQNSSTIADLK